MFSLFSKPTRARRPHAIAPSPRLRASSSCTLTLMILLGRIISRRWQNGFLINMTCSLQLVRGTEFYQFPEEARFPSRSTYRDANGAKWLAADWANARCMTQPGMFLMPRQLIASVGGWNESLSLIDDFEFFARVISRSAGVRFAPESQAVLSVCSIGQSIGAE